MKKFIPLILPVFLAFTAAAQSPNPNQVSDQQPVNENGPEFQFDEETHNFGEVPEGPNAVYDFKFKNVGKEPLIITNARASCGCTVPQWPKEPILPGQEGTIQVSYTTKGRPGAINKTITISSNAKTKEKMIRIVGTVIAPEPPPNGNPEKTPTLLEMPNK